LRTLVDVLGRSHGESESGVRYDKKRKRGEMKGQIDDMYSTPPLRIQEAEKLGVEIIIYS
jgi:hypothetical protein